MSDSNDQKQQQQQEESAAQKQDADAEQHTDEKKTQEEGETASSPPSNENQQQDNEKEEAAKKEQQKAAAPPEEEEKAAEKSEEKSSQKKGKSKQKEEASSPPPPNRNVSPDQRQPIPPDLAPPDELLKPSYKNLSDKPRAPGALMIGKRRDFADEGLPGPGEYDPDSRPDSRAPKMVSSQTLRLKEKEILDVPYYSPRFPTGRSAKFGAPPSEPKTARVNPPGPGSYELPSQFRPKKPEEAKSSRCTFGMPYKPAQPTFRLAPGPGAYEVDNLGGTRKTNRLGSSHGGKATQSVSNKSPREPRASTARTAHMPGPGSYDLGSTFGPKYGQCLPSIKGRLAHPMDDRNAAHECAKTSSPRNQLRTMRARPRGY